MLVRLCVQAKEPGRSAIVQADQATHPHPPLRLEAEEHFNGGPVVVPHLKVSCGRCVIGKGDAKDGGIIRRLVLNRATSPMLSGLDQFFLLAPERLLK